MIGEKNAGKSTLLAHRENDKFMPDLKKTVEAVHHGLYYKVENEICYLNIYDTTGWMRYSMCGPMYLHHCEAVLIIFDASKAVDLDKFYN